MELLTCLVTPKLEEHECDRYMFLLAEGKVLYRANAWNKNDIFSVISVQTKSISVDGFNVIPYIESSEYIEKLHNNGELDSYFKILDNQTESNYWAAVHYAKDNGLTVVMTVSENPSDLQSIVGLVEYYKLERVLSNRFDSILIMKQENVESAKTILGLLNIPTYVVTV